MPIRTTRFYALQVACFVLLAWMLAGAQVNLNRLSKDEQSKDDQNRAPSPATPGADYSGMSSVFDQPSINC
ncbi:MAG: hypothetical protein ABSA80_07810 [Terriglobales bacterium]|jgi:hypothetical protein